MFGGTSLIIIRGMTCARSQQMVFAHKGSAVSTGLELLLYGVVISRAYGQRGIHFIRKQSQSLLINWSAAINHVARPR